MDDFTLTGGGTTGPVTGKITGPGGKCVGRRGRPEHRRHQGAAVRLQRTAAQNWAREGSTLRALGKCMDVAGGVATDGTRVQIYTCNGTGAQNWTVNGSTLRALGKCLDGANAAQLVIRTCDGSAAQNWTLPGGTTPDPDPGTGAGDVLVFSRTAGFRHDSIPAGVQAIRDLGFTVSATEDPAAFTTANLARYKAVVFLNTTGDVLDAGQQAAFESYVRAGGGYAGIHAASDTEYDWPWYGNLVGAWFASHPAVQQATVKVQDRAHPSTAHLGPTWSRTDEWYDFRTNARTGARVLATLDESTYSGGGMGADHPIAWCKAYDGGRSFYTGGGHTAAAFAEPAFRQHLLGGLNYATERRRPTAARRTATRRSTTAPSPAGAGLGTGSFANAPTPR
ncbi:ThuA domain-containing protein [Streptosporangium vulgare]|uniref:ThuA domain-containing protein n=1 Tax=Streptosporangium vulgare TaxID=46190 RepID=UPI0031DA9577